MLSEASGCPYCLAARNLKLPPGTSVIFLSEIDVGQTGIIVSDDFETCPSDQFLVRMDYETRPEITRMVMPNRELYLDKSLLQIPSWMPPLSIEDNAAIHDRLMLSLDNLNQARDRVQFSRALTDLIERCWRHRLPLSGEGLWDLLKAHNLPPHRKTDTVEFYNFGISLLTRTNGRPSVKRRHMPPMSKGRYLTKAERSLRLAIFGHD